jgi:hypothetical protein
VPGRQPHARRGDQAQRGEDGEHHEAVALARRHAPGQRAHAIERVRRKRGRHAGEQRNDERSELRACERERRQHEQPDAERRQRAAGVAELDAHGQRHHAGRRGRPHPARPGRVAREAHAQQRTNCRQRSHRVPVGERLLEPAAGHQ